MKKMESSIMDHQSSAARGQSMVELTRPGSQVPINQERNGDHGSAEQQASENCCSRCVDYGLKTTEDGFAALGRFTAKRPFLVLLMSCLVCLLCSLGFLNYEEESRPEKLWVPQDTEAVQDFEYVSSVWKEEPRFNIYFATEKDVPLNSPAAIQKLYNLHERVLAINVSASSHTDQFPGKWDYERACFRTGSTCATVTVLDLFDYNKTLIDSLTTEEINRRIFNESFYTTASGRTFTMNDIIGLDANGQLAAYRGMYALDPHVVTEGNERTDVVGIPWEAEGIDIFNGDTNPLDTYPMFVSSWSTEFSKAISQDSTSLTIAFIIIIIYLIFTLGRRDPVDCMVGLSFCAVISVGMALAASWGLASAVGEFFTPLHNVIPFLLVGLGVDDAFILVTSYQRAMKEYGDHEKAIEKALRVGGMSILITSLTDFLAFAIGSTTNLPALSSFCIYAGLGVIFDFFFQITFFMACLVLNARRTEAKRRDVFVCVKDGDEEFKSYQSEARGCCMFQCGCAKQDIAEPIFDKYARVLVTWPARIVVLLVFFVFIGLSSYGINQMEVNFRNDWFLPPDSYLLDSIDVFTDYFDQSTLFNVYMKDIDYFTRQDELNAVGEFLVNSSQVLEGTSDYWYAAFLSWAAMTSPYAVVYNSSSRTITNETLFYEGLYQYLNTNGSRYRQDVKFFDNNNPTQGIFASRTGAQISKNEYQGLGPEKFNAMEDLRADLAEAMPYDDARAFAFVFIFWERFGVIQDELIQNLAIALAVMCGIVFLLIYTLPIVTAVVVAIGATVLDVYGMAYFWGVQINFVVTIFLLIAIGLSVDYSAHIGHAFKEAHGTAEERVIEAMRGTGPPVFNAIFSTFISILILVTARTYIFEVFFQMFTLTTLFGGFHGLVVLPVLLCIMGGSKAAPEKAKSSHDDSAINVIGKKKVEHVALKDGDRKEAC